MASKLPPGEIVYGKRTQQLSATLEGAIAGCLSIVTNGAGGLQIVLDTNCVLPEVVGLLQDTVTANSFVFAARTCHQASTTYRYRPRLMPWATTKTELLPPRHWSAREP